MKYLKTIYLLLCCTLALAACSDDDENSASGALSITTPAYTNVGYNKATLSANISGTEGVNIVKRGFCYATASHPDIYDTTSEVRGSEISTTLTGLTPQTTYYVRAFVTLYNEEPRYSEETSFTTSAETLSDELAAYEAPTYVDDYTSFSAWSNRYDWNLANVHDPTVMKADDGYYYMYQTDASYGNAHSGNGHFHARRSKDLVNWEYLGATMSETPPTWIKEKLNAYRQEMGLEPIDNPSYRYETFISSELVKYIDGHYKTIADRKGRAITGLSMGGHGAMWNAIRHKDVFGAAGTTSGGMDIRPFPQNWEMAKQLGEFAANKKVWDEYTVINQIDKIENGDLAIIIDCGEADFFLNVNKDLHNRLLARKINHDFVTRPGGHTGKYWNNSIDYQILFFDKFFKK